MRRVAIRFKDGTERVYLCKEISFDGDKRTLRLISDDEVILIDFHKVRALKEVNIREERLSKYECSNN